MTEPDAPRDQLPTDLAAAAEMRARHGFDIVQSDPSGARVELSAVLQDRRSPVIARLIAQWGLGRLLHDTGEVESAAAMLADAVDLAIAAGCRAEESQIRLSWAASLQATGDYDEAMAQLAIAEVGLRGAALGRLQMQRGLVLMNLGSTDAAIREYGRALPRLRTDGDRLGEARLLTNRGVALTQLGRNLLARADFVRAGELAEALGQHLIVAGAHHNLGYLHSRLGHVPEALTEYAEARRRYIELGSPGRLLAALDADQCDMDLFAGLSTEALQSAERLRVDAYESGNMMQLGEAHLLAARAHLLGGQPETARIEAKTAARLFIATGRTPWAAFAEYVEVVAAAVGGEATQAGLPTTSAAADGIEETINRLLRVAATLERMGWVAAAAEVQIQLAQRAITAGRLDVAGPALAAASVSRSHGTARLRAQAWHATALLHMVTGQPGRAKRAISSGLQVVDRYRATLGASELRVRASAIGVDLAALGLEIALRSGHPTEVFTAAERWRAGALAPRVKIGFVGDRRVDDDLIELRRLERQAREMMLDGQPSESSRAQVDARRAALVRIERRITERARLAAGDPRAVAGRLDIHRLRSELGDALMVEYIDFRGQIYGVVAGERRTRLVQLPKRDVVFELIDHLLFAVRRVAALPVRHSRVADALRALNQAAAELDELLVQPLRLQDRPLVVVPTGRLHGLPWAALPRLRAAPSLTIAPSAMWWLRGADDQLNANTGRVLLAHGPGLPNAATELDAIVGVVGRPALSLVGGDATVARVMSEAAAADLMHIAAHGSFRADNPMFSSLQLADGLLYVYDLQRLKHTPRAVILTACSAGASGVYSGDELLGTSIALLSLGVHSVIAPLLAVPDEATAAFAVAIHQAMQRGAGPDVALAMAGAAAVASGDPSAIAVAAAFQMIGIKI